MARQNKIVKLLLKPIIEKAIEKALDKKKPSSLPLVNQFPKLRELLEDLLTDQFESFIFNIDWVAPKPTTFRVTLSNNQIFYVQNTRNTWVVTIEGKRYYMLNVSDTQRACESLARILKYGTNIDKVTNDLPSNSEVSMEDKPKEEEPESKDGGEKPKD